MFLKFSAKDYFNGSERKQLECLNKAAEFAQKTKKQENFYSAMTAICFIFAIICFICAAGIHFYSYA